MLSLHVGLQLRTEPFCVIQVAEVLKPLNPKSFVAPEVPLLPKACRNQTLCADNSPAGAAHSPA